MSLRENLKAPLDIVNFTSLEEMSGKLKFSWFVSTLTFPLAFVTG